MLDFLYRTAASVCGYLIGALLLVEPNNVVWISAISGSLGAVVLGKDKSLRLMAGHFFVGLTFAVFASQLVAWVVHVPQPPVAFMLGIFGILILNGLALKIETDGVSWLLPRWLGGSPK
jgi:TRAP-type C4-dicarboxylate transport system permease large subunit